jgi:nuclear pore complex protein Nup155
MYEPVTIRSTWVHLIEAAHKEAVENNIARPYEKMIEVVRNVGLRVRLSDMVFPVPVILPLLERYKFENQRGMGPPTWVVDVFLDLEIPHEVIYSTLEAMFYNDEAPFSGPNRRVIGNDLVYLISRWFMDSIRGGGQVFGSDVVANAVSTALQMLQQNGVDENWANEARALRARIEQMLR